jgi:tRNA-splicing ligase RtcB
MDTPRIVETEDAFGFIPVSNGTQRNIPVVGTRAIRDAFDPVCIQQAITARCSPGVSELILNPDAHVGYGAPIGCVLVSPSHVYPGPVGFDIKCSMSLLQLDLPEKVIGEKSVRRSLIGAIEKRLPTGPGKGQRSVPQSRHISREDGIAAVVHGATPEVCSALGIPTDWRMRCEDASHTGHDGTVSALENRMDRLLRVDAIPYLDEKLSQLGSYGGGNHFGECSVVRMAKGERAHSVAAAFGLREGAVAFLSHCGSRGFGYALASRQFKLLQERFEEWGIPFPGGDKQLVYAPLASSEANDYLDDLALGGNFATLNHLIINSLVLEAFQEIFPGTTGSLINFISHNFARLEQYRGTPCWVLSNPTNLDPPRSHEPGPTPSVENIPQTF